MSDQLLVFVGVVVAVALVLYFADALR